MSAGIYHGEIEPPRRAEEGKVIAANLTGGRLGGLGILVAVFIHQPEANTGQPTAGLVSHDTQDIRAWAIAG